MSKSLLAAVLLPLVACSAKNAKPEVAASESDTEQDSRLYEPDDDTTAGTTAGTTDRTMGTTGATGTTGSTDTDTESATAGTMGGSMGSMDANAPTQATASADQDFVQKLIPHQEEGIRLAKLAQQRAEHAELKELAGTMISKQEAQIAELKTLSQGFTDDAGIPADDGLDDLHGELNKTGTPAPSTHDATASHDGVAPAAADGLDQPVGADKTASQDDASATGDDLTAAQDDDATGMTGTTPGATGSLGYDDGADKTASQDGANAPGADPMVPQGSQDRTAATGAQDGQNVPGDDMTASDDAQVDVPKDHEALASAEEFDKAFLDAMIKHHEKGIEMVKGVSPRLENPELKQLADAIVAGQSEEVARMKGWRQAWFESDTVTSM